jgi:hypothetical protein
MNKLSVREDIASNDSTALLGICRYSEIEPDEVDMQKNTIKQ